MQLSSVFTVTFDFLTLFHLTSQDQPLAEFGLMGLSTSDNSSCKFLLIVRLISGKRPNPGPWLLG